MGRTNSQLSGGGSSPVAEYQFTTDFMGNNDVIYDLVDTYIMPLIPNSDGAYYITFSGNLTVNYCVKDIVLYPSFSDNGHKIGAFTRYTNGVLAGRLTTVEATANVKSGTIMRIYKLNEVIPDAE